MTMGAIHHFFRSRRNSKNSLMIEKRLMLAMPAQTARQEALRKADSLVILAAKH